MEKWIWGEGEQEAQDRQIQGVSGKAPQGSELSHRTSKMADKLLSGNLNSKRKKLSTRCRII